MRATSLRFTCVSSIALGLSSLGLCACGGGEELNASELNANMPSATTSAPPPGSSGPVSVAPTPASNDTSGPGTVAPPPGPGEPQPVVDPGPMPTMPTPGTGPDMSATTPPPGPGGPEPEVEVQPGPAEGGSPGVSGAGGVPVGPNPEPVTPAGGMGVGGSVPMPEPMVEPTVVPAGPYDPRTGPFRMLAYSKTGGFRHGDAINTGKTMLQAIADEQGFEVSFTETNEEITLEGLSQYEIVFFLNSTGDIFNGTEQQAYEDWMTTQNGAFAGVHSATDTENGWAFYSEVTGQYYDLHEPCCSQANIQWDPEALNMVMVQGLPNPWPRSEEWYYFNRNAEWSAKSGFQILSRVTSSNSTRPVSYVREWGNFRAFYTSLGHEGSVFQDDLVKRHVAAGIMWAVRREAEFVP